MFSLILESLNFCFENAKRELDNLKVNYKIVKDDSFRVDLGSEKKLVDFFSKVYFNSNFFVGVFLLDGKKKVDMVGFDLSKRDYKLNGEEVSSLVVNMLIENLEIKEKKFSFIDPIARKGDVLIEVLENLCNSNKHFKQRFEIPFVEKFGDLSLPKKIEKNIKVQGVVQDSLDFKYLKENVSYSSKKVKISEYELDWLDVKFREGEFDYLITFLEDEDLVEDLLYQGEFVTKKKIGIVSLFELDKKVVKSKKLKAISYSAVEFNEEVYHIYVLN